MKVLVKILGVLTVILLAVSFAFLSYQWYKINGLSITMFLFPITVIKVNPLGVVFFEQPLYVINFTTKYVLDLLFLVPYTLAILVTGPICIFISLLGGVSYHEKYRNVANKFWSMATKGTREQRILLIGSIVIIVAFYVVAVFLSVIRSTTLLLEPLGILLITFILGIQGLTIAVTRLQKIRKTV
ncbi:MAG: hypothetical protein QXR19_05665 [Candidatus Jordarchaeaceae archaeon]